MSNDALTLALSRVSIALRAAHVCAQDTGRTRLIGAVAEVERAQRKACKEASKPRQRRAKDD
jgi:hypothetical protein